MQTAPVLPRRYVDLHIHTIHSDGSSTVSEVLEAASRKGLAAIAITDHDCIDAYPTAIELGSQMGVEVIPGLELSSEIENADLHILGYYIDFTDPALNRILNEMKEARYLRARKMVENLNIQGVDLRFETVLSMAGIGAIGRPHIAAAMLKEELVYSFREAFEKYLGYGMPAYVEKYKMRPRDVFDLVKGAGGIPVLAHPGVTKVDDRLQEFINDGVQGLEAYHTEHSASVQQQYLKIARKCGLAVTGGSDFHNASHNKSEIGVPRVPYSAVKSLKDKRNGVAAEDGAP
jgi:predicted metal-dependent phosphoesterase TrpH